MPLKQVIAMGGGGFSMEPENPLLDVYILAQARKKTPSVCFFRGNTRSMLALWREWGLDRMLRKAYEEGVVLAGISAGANCWFEQCSTDSVPGKLSVMDCLGIIGGSFCPHYDGEVSRRPTLHAFIASGSIKEGWVADDGAAVHFIDGAYSSAVSSRPAARAYRLFRSGDAAAEEALATRFLGA
jgi:dipeptidase E